MNKDAGKENIFSPLIERGMELCEFEVSTGGRKVSAIIASPPARQLAADPVLLLTVGKASTHFLPPNEQPAEYFWKRGHRVVAFSSSPLPDSLETLRDNVLSGPDPFEAFVRDARAVLSYCIEQKWARRGRIVVTGISRFAYLAFRLLAEDEDLKIGGGFAPVTDWRDLHEFSPARHLPQIADLRLSRFADKLAGKKIYLVIGSHDERVNTRSACQLFLDLNAANARRGLDASLIDLYVTPEPDHSCTEEWINRGMEILLNDATSKL